jgi:hypothetical protein
MAAKTKKAAGPSVEEQVSQALVKVATSDVPLRLAGKGDHPPLFAKASTATARLQDEADPLVTVVGTGKAAHVKLTAAGFRQALPHLPEEQVGAAAKELAAGLPAAARVEFLNEIIGRTPAAAAELLPLYEEAVAAEKVEAEARIATAAKRREREEATRQALARWLEVTAQRQRQRVDALRRELEAEGEKAPPPASATHTAEVQPSRSPVSQLTPETAEDRDFRRQVARRLVSSWLDTWEMNKPDARQFLETAIWNLSGFRLVGEPGEQATFDGALHEGPAGVFTGDAVRVVRPGWVLEEDDGREYRILKALVSP